MKRLNFEQALNKTIDVHHSFFGSIFQIIITACAISSIMTGFVILGGISFLEKVPNKFECMSDSLSIIQQRNENMTHVSAFLPHMEPIKPKGQWKQCSQQFICKNNLNLYKDLFRFDQSDPEYIDNWIQKFDLLCKPTEYIGLIGSCYMVGMFIGFFILPPNSDSYGRRPVFIVTMILSTIAQGVILFTSDIHKLFLFMIILGTTFSGKNIVGLNFAIECTPLKHRNFVISIYWSIELSSIILWSFYYQKLDKNWFPLQMIYFILGIISMLLAIFMLPESPKYYYSKQRFDDARKVLSYISSINGKPKQKLYLFDNEVESEEQIERRLKQEQLQKEIESLRENEDKQNEILDSEESDELIKENNVITTVVIRQELSETQLFQNLVKMTLMWTQASFNQFLLSAQMKYLEGNIFINFYIFGFAGIFAVLIGGVSFTKFGLKKSYIIAFTMSIVGLVGMFIIQIKVVKFSTDDLREGFDEKLMPVLILILKMGIILSFITTTQVSFTDDRIFPSNKRNTSVGTCGMIARSITIVAPIVNEWPSPFPVVVMFFFTIIGLLTAITFPKENEFTPGQIQKQMTYDYGKENTLKLNQNEKNAISTGNQYENDSFKTSQMDENGDPVQVQNNADVTFRDLSKDMKNSNDDDASKFDLSTYDGKIISEINLDIEKQAQYCENNKDYKITETISTDGNIFGSIKSQSIDTNIDCQIKKDEKIIDENLNNNFSSGLGFKNKQIKI